MVYRSNSGWGKILFQFENVNLYTAIQKLLLDLNIKEGGSKSSRMNAQLMKQFCY